jgi:hypothetical protein
MFVHVPGELELVVATVLSVAASWRWWKEFRNCSFNLHFSAIHWEPSEMSEGVIATLLLPSSQILLAACCFVLQNPSQEMPSIMVISNFLFISERRWNHWSWALSYTYISSGTYSCSCGCRTDNDYPCCSFGMTLPFPSIIHWVYVLTLYFSVCCSLSCFHCLIEQMFYSISRTVIWGRALSKCFTLKVDYE